MSWKSENIEKRLKKISWRKSYSRSLLLIFNQESKNIIGKLLAHRSVNRTRSSISLPQQYHSFWVILLRVEFGRVWPPRVLPAIFLVSLWILHPKWLISWKKFFLKLIFFSSKFWNLHFHTVVPYRNRSWKSENIEKKLKNNYVEKNIFVDHPTQFQLGIQKCNQKMCF